MSKEYAIPCAIFKIPFNGSRTDVYRIGCTHLQYFLRMNGISADCKPMMLKMHLELDDSPLAAEAEKQNIEHNNSNNHLSQQLEDNEIRAAKDVLQPAKIDCRVKLQKNNIVVKHPEVGNSTIAHDRANDWLFFHDNDPSHLDEFDWEENVFEPDNTTADVSSRAAQNNYSKKKRHRRKCSNSKKQMYNGGNGESDKNNDAEDDIASASKGSEMTQKEEEDEEKVLFDDENEVLIWGIKTFDSSEDSAMDKIIELAKQMDLKLARDQIKAIYVIRANIHFCNYWVHFRTKAIKDAFLENKHILTEFLQTRFLSIEDDTPRSCVLIRNFHCSTSSEDSAMYNVIELAKQMGLSDIRGQILYIDVIHKFDCYRDYWIHFRSKSIKKAFLEKKHILKEFSQTKFAVIIP